MLMLEKNNLEIPTSYGNGWRASFDREQRSHDDAPRVRVRWILKQGGDQANEQVCIAAEVI
ncbi:MAG TPA: hypothetical protein VI122_22160, partial [Thermoleophilaceae bacterium]